MKGGERQGEKDAEWKGLGLVRGREWRVAHNAQMHGLGKGKKWEVEGCWERQGEGRCREW